MGEWGSMEKNTMKLKTHSEIKKFVIETIKSGDKQKIIKVLKRYNEWLKENDIVEQAKKLFGVKEVK